MIDFNIIIAFLTSLISLIILRPFAVKLNLVDYPNHRKNHNGNVPIVGGACILLGLLASSFGVTYIDKFSSVLLITASLIFILGVWDDFVNLNAKTKMAFQALITALLIYLTNVKIESLGYLFSFSSNFELGVLAIPLTIIAVVGLTNAINMIDGLDGLAAGLILLAIVGLFCFNLKLEVSPFNNTLFPLVFALLPFMFFNIAPYPKMKIFLGDGGSLFLGYIISWELINSAENINNFSPSFALWCVAIPLFDFLSVIIIRVFEKRSLMIAHKDHIHHLLVDLGFSKKLTLVLIVSAGVIFFLIGSMIEHKFPTLSFPSFIILFLLYLFIRIYIGFAKKDKVY